MKSVVIMLFLFVLLSATQSAFATECKPIGKLPTVCTTSTGYIITGRAGSGAVAIHTSKPMRVISQFGHGVQFDAAQQEKLLITSQGRYRVEIETDPISLVAIDAWNTHKQRIVVDGVRQAPIDRGGIHYLEEGYGEGFFRFVDPVANDLFPEGKVRRLRTIYSQDLSRATVDYFIVRSPDESSQYLTGPKGSALNYTNLQSLQRWRVEPAKACHDWYLKAVVYPDGDTENGKAVYSDVFSIAHNLTGTCDSALIFPKKEQRTAEDDLQDMINSLLAQVAALQQSLPPSRDNDRPLEGNAYLLQFEVDDASADEVEEGTEDAEIAEITVEFKDGDAKISRIDLTLEGTGDERDPWDVFESISLWVDGDKVAEVPANDRSYYMNEVAGTLRVAGFELIAREDEDVEIIVAASLQGNLDGVLDGEAWTVTFDGISYVDADGFGKSDDSTGDLGDTTGISFTIIREGSYDELIAKASPEDPDSTTFVLENNGRSDWYTAFSFKLDTDNSTNDIELNTITLNVVTTGASFNTLINDAKLIIDGESIDDYTVSAGDTNRAVIIFDVDGDVTIEANDQVKADLALRFKALAPANEGATVKGLIDPLSIYNVDAVGANRLENAQLSGSAVGETHTLRVSGIVTNPISATTGVTFVDGSLNDYATYVITFDVTAFGQDVYIPTDPQQAVVYVIEDAAGNQLLGGARTAQLTSTADEAGSGDSFFEVSEGATETFTLTVTHQPGSQESGELALQSLTFDETGTSIAADNQNQQLTPAVDFRTNVVIIVN